MSAVRHGAQWASRSLRRTPLSSDVPVPTRSRRPRRRTLIDASALVMAVLVAIASVAALPSPTRAATTNYLLMARSELMSLPVSGTAWSALKQVADGSLGTPDLCDQNSKHHLRTLAAALVYARTGIASYGTKARSGVMAALPTQKPGCGNAVLALGRQLLAYVLAADFADLSGASDATFRTWLSGIRTKDIGGHSIWRTLTGTHKSSANNWGAHAGASRIAASLYLGDTTDVAAAAKVTQGFLGNRSAYAGFGYTLDSTDLSWSCDSAATYTPENRSCTKSGINVDGAIIADISRAGALTWPPGSTGISYQVDSVAAMALQVELLYRHGYPSAWGWSSSAVRRGAQIVQRSDAAGGDGWNLTTASSQIPWLLNRRYGTFLPTRHTPLGRSIGFADWLWGTTAIASLPAPTVNTPSVRTSTGSAVPLGGVPVVVGWSLASTSDGLSRYDLQMSVDGGAWANQTLASATATSKSYVLSTAKMYAFRVRAVDRSGRVGSWKASAPKGGWRVNDTSRWLVWSGPWSTASSTSFLDGGVHRSKTYDARVTLTFDGSSVAWVSPVGPTYGKAHVFVDGVYIQTVDTYASTWAARKVVFVRNLTQGRHTIMLRVLGTSGRPTVNLDGLYVIHD